jgi:DsbC/DsbD-like thiol-disulfide interchange protein
MFQYINALAWAVAFASPVAAQVFADVPAEARLTPGWETAPGERMAGLQIALDPGWKTYWRAPGEAGIPPVFDWSGSENLSEVEVFWPAPMVFDSFGLTTIGYDGVVTLPVRVVAADPSRPVRVRLTLDYGVCADLCVPARAELALELAPGSSGRRDAAIADAQARLPRNPAAAGVAEARCVLRGAGEQRVFEARIGFEAPPKVPLHVVVEGPEGVWFGPAATQVDGSALDIVADAEIWSDIGWIGREDLDVTLLYEGWATALPGCGA